MKFERRGDITPEEKQQMEELEKEEEQREEEEAKNDKTMKKRQRSVLIYMALLFVVALGLVVLSYFVQQRHTENQINDLTEQHSQFSIQALENIEELQNTNQELQQQIDEKDEQLEDLQEELDTSEEKYEQQIEQLEDDLEQLTQKYTALEALNRAAVALENGDRETASAQIAIIEPIKEALPEDMLEVYERLQNRLG